MQRKGENSVIVFDLDSEPDAVHILYRRLLDRDPDPEGLRAAAVASS